MRREPKIWGERWMVREDSTHTTNILTLKAGYRCSWHRHTCKYNLFAVISGVVEIDAERNGCRTTTELYEGQALTVEPGVWHEFRVIEDGLMLEEMYVEYDDTDIDRMKIGGPMDD